MYRWISALCFLLLSAACSGNTLYDFDGDGTNDSPIQADTGNTWAFGYFRPRHIGGDSLDGTIDSRKANVLFPDLHVKLRSFRQWLENDNNLWGNP